MKQFAYKLIVFFAIMVVLDQATGAVMDRIYAGTVKGDYGRNNYIATGVHADCLIFGSSRAIHHYDPDRIGRALGMSCYNCGEEGMGIITMFGRFREVTARYTPKLIIYDVTGGFDFNVNDNSKYIGFLRYYDNNPDVQKIINDVDGTEKYKSLAKSYKYNSRFLDILSQRISRDPLNAKDFKYVPMRGEIDYAVKDEPVSKTIPKLDTLKMNCFREMIHYCKSMDIRIVLVVSPWYHAKADKALQPLINLCVQNDIPFLNHWTDTTFIYDTHLFNDPSHLNQQGAEIFDEIITKEIAICHKK